MQLKRDPAAMGGTYEFTKLASANLRERNDSMNSAVGGLFAGSLLGLKRKPLQFTTMSIDALLTYCRWFVTGSSGLRHSGSSFAGRL